MATSPIAVRKKRNFKALQLSVTEATGPQSAKDAEVPVATREAPPPAVVSAPVGGAKKRPPPMVIKAPKITNRDVGIESAVEQDTMNTLTVGVTVSNGPPSAVPVRRNTYHAHLSDALANLDMNSETRIDLKPEDLRDLTELGAGNGGSVKKVEHIPTKTMMAKKVRIVLLSRRLSVA